jgi:putative oxidoreductase
MIAVREKRLICRMRPIIPFLAPLWAALAEPAYALLRLTAGGFLVPHGLWKLFGITGSQEEMLAFFHAIGMEPAFPLMIAVGLVETVGGVLIALGLLTRPAAFAATVTTATAAITVHLPLGFYVEPGGVEFSALWAVVLLYIGIRGGGAISLDRAIGREF